MTAPFATPPKVSKSNATKGAILKAARSLFVEHGYSGTSMGKIAIEAKVNHSLLFHYFENKQNLWREVKQSILEEGKAKSPIIPSLKLPFPSFLKELMTQSIHFYRTSPDIVRMVNWQRLEHDSLSWSAMTQSEESKNWTQAFAHYQQTGDINPALKPDYIIALVLSIFSFAALDANILIKKPEDQRGYIDFCVSFLVSGFE